MIGIYSVYFLFAFIAESVAQDLTQWVEVMYEPTTLWSWILCGNCWGNKCEAFADSYQIES